MKYKFFGIINKNGKQTLATKRPTSQTGTYEIPESKHYGHDSKLIQYKYSAARHRSQLITVHAHKAPRLHMVISYLFSNENMPKPTLEKQILVITNARHDKYYRNNRH